MIRKILLSLAILLLFTSGGCVSWENWNGLFDRTSVIGSGRGWVGGDGGQTVLLPGGRMLWIFGDSYITAIDPATNNRVPVHPLVDTVFGNTIGLQPERWASDPLDIAFYARLNDGSNLVDDVTVVESGARKAFFNYTMLGLDPPTLGPGLIWPSGLYCQGCASSDPKLIASLLEVVICTPGPSEPDCFPFEDKGLYVGRGIIVKLDNVELDPENWIVEQTVVVSPAGASSNYVQWGKDFINEGGWVYIYGTQGLGVTDLVVARSLPSDMTDASKWQVFTSNGWVQGLTGATPLPVAEKVGSIISVDKVVRDGTTAYVLVHNHPAQNHYLFVRSSDNMVSWDNLDETTPRIDLVDHDPKLKAVVDSLVQSGDCQAPIVNGVPDTDACGVVYHGHVQYELSKWDSTQIADLLFSYTIPKGPVGDETDADYYKPRFGYIPLANTQPWCSGGNMCLRGVNHVMEGVAISQGEEQTYNFDISNSDYLTVRYIDETGDITLDFTYGSPPVVTTADCQPESKPGSQICDVNFPVGETQAVVKVNSAGSTSYDLWVSYDGVQGY